MRRWASSGRGSTRAAFAGAVHGAQRAARVTLGADKGYDRKEFVLQLREHQVTPHIACKQTSIIDARTTSSSGLPDQPRKAQTG